MVMAFALFDTRLSRTRYDSAKRIVITFGIVNPFRLTQPVRLTLATINVGLSGKIDGQQEWRREGG